VVSCNGFEHELVSRRCVNKEMVYMAVGNKLNEVLIPRYSWNL